MKLAYMPLLQIQRDLYEMPRNMDRFNAYIDIITNDERDDVAIAPLVIANPMAKEHVNAALDILLAMDADGIGARTAREISTTLLPDAPGDFKAALVVVDDQGGWTNRWTWEHDVRFGPDRFRTRKGDPITKRFWVTGLLWATVTYDERAIREAMLVPAYRAVYVQEHGHATTVRTKLAQEGWALAMAGCDEPALDADDLEYTREIIEPSLEDPHMRTAVECLFGDDASRSLGFTPRGLSPWAGLALALYDAKTKTRLSS
jgi:hypothetical protein